MSRSQRESEAKNKTPQPQLEGYAFTINGHALVDGMTDREKPEFICAYHQRGQYKTALSDAQKKLQADPENADPVFRNDAAHSDREKGEPEPGVKLFMIVGYMLRDPPADGDKKISKKQAPVGHVLPKPENITQWDPKAIPVLVVTEVLNQRPDGIQLWALIKPMNGLCTPYSVALELVYYRTEFRDHTTNKKGRSTSWNSKVAFHSVRPGMNAAPLTEKQHKFKRAKDPVKLCFDPNVSLANEIASLAANYRHTSDEWYLQEIKEVLQSVDSDLNYRPLPENAGLRLFHESEEPLTDEESQEVVENFLQLWPETKNVTANRIKMLHAAILGVEDIHLEYRMLRPFIAEACHIIVEKELKKEDLAVMIVEVLGMLERVMGPIETAPSISTDDGNALLKVLLVKLKEINQAGLDGEEKMKAGFGDSAFDHTSEDIWAQYGSAVDTDTTRAAWCQELKLVVAAVRQKETGLRGMIEDLIAPLEKLRL